MLNNHFALVIQKAKQISVECINHMDIRNRQTIGLKGLFYLLCCGFSLAAHAVSFSDAQNTYRAGNIDQALGEVINVLKSEPDNVPALFLQAQILSANKQNSAAIKTYQQLIRLEPSHLEAYNNLATIYAQQGELELASKTLENAIKTDPIYNTIHTNLRAIYMDMSRKHYRLALKQESQDSKTQLLAINTGNSANQIVHKPVQVGTNTTLIATAKTEPIVQTETQGQRLTEAASKPKPKPVPQVKTQAKKQTEAKQSEKKPRPKVKQNTPTPPKPKVIKTATIAKKKPETNTSVGANANSAIKKALLSWANAWSNRDVVKYVNAYQHNYATPGKTNQDWVAGRRWNFKTKKYIKVALSDISIKADGNKFRTIFKQAYESDTFKDSVSKVLIFVNQNGRWKIAQEHTT